MPKELQPAARDYTIVLHKECHGVQFKKKAPRAIKAIKALAAKNMSTSVMFSLCIASLIRTTELM
jgi:ribosomal protein L31E